MFIRPSFVTLIIAVAALGAPFKRDEKQVEKDIQELDKQSWALDASVNAFPSSGGMPTQVEDIHVNAQKLYESIEMATNDVNASENFTADEVNTMSKLIDGLTSDVKKGIDDLVAKKNAFSHLGKDSIVRSDLETLKTGAGTLANAFIAKTPADLKDEYEIQFNALQNDFNYAINTYST